LERDIIPMCKAEGMGIAPFGTLGGGKFKSEQQRQTQEGRPAVEFTESDIKVTQTLEKVAGRLNTAITSVALAYVMHKAPYVFPIVGGRKVDHLKGNIDALTLALAPEDIKEIESAVPFDLGFPHTMLWGSEVPDAVGRVSLLAMNGTVDHVKDLQVCSS
jgi:aryl-alcohol dehydrogenase-like predicted oxidoreductase